MKYDFIKIRLNELGKTQTEFAEAIGITQSKLNVTLNHPELREFQTSEILKAAEFLGYNTESFVAYVAGNPEKPSVNITKNVNTSDILMIADIVKEFFEKNGYEITPEQRAALVDHFYQQNITDAGKIKELLSVMQAFQSGIKGK